MAESAVARGNAVIAARYGELSAESTEAGIVIRDLLVRLP